MKKNSIEKLIMFCQRDSHETRLIIKNLKKEIVLDGNVKRNESLKNTIHGLEDSIIHNDEIVSDLNKLKEFEYMTDMEIYKATKDTSKYCDGNEAARWMRDLIKSKLSL